MYMFRDFCISIFLIKYNLYVICYMEYFCVDVFNVIHLLYATQNIFVPLFFSIRNF